MFLTFCPASPSTDILHFLFPPYIIHSTLVFSESFLRLQSDSARDHRSISLMRLYLRSNDYFVRKMTDTVYMTLHLLPPVGSPGFCDFSISAINCSNAFPTLLFSRALASVKLQLNSSAKFLPSSAWTWR